MPQMFPMSSFFLGVLFMSLIIVMISFFYWVPPFFQEASSTGAGPEPCPGKQAFFTYYKW